MVSMRKVRARRLKISERYQQKMDFHFPDINPILIWRRQKNDGFTTVPRTMPIVMQAIDAQSKGKPAGHILFCLWARSLDNPLMIIENPATFAVEAGFSGERAVDTWRKRMKILRELRMIQTKPGPSGEFHYTLLLNPNVAVEWMWTQGMVQERIYDQFVNRLIEVGASGELEAANKFWDAQKTAAGGEELTPKPT